MAGLVSFFSEFVGDLGIGWSYEVARPGSLLVGVVCTTYKLARKSWLC